MNSIKYAYPQNSFPKFEFCMQLLFTLVESFERKFQKAKNGLIFLINNFILSKS